MAAVALLAMNRALHGITLSLLLATPLAAQRGEEVFTAPNWTNVFVDIENAPGREPGHIIWITNHSSVPILITGITMQSCENIKQRCTGNRLRVKVVPNGKAIAFRVGPKDPLARWTYRNVSFTWQVDPGDPIALQKLADAGYPKSSEELREAALGRVGTARRAPTASSNSSNSSDSGRLAPPQEPWLDVPALTTLGEKLAGIVAIPVEVSVLDGRFFRLGDIRIVAVDSAGNSLGRLSGGIRWSVPATDILITRADTVFAAMPGKAEVIFQLRPPLRPLEAKLVVIVRPDTTG
jgi:hypothetical protein